MPKWLIISLHRCHCQHVWIVTGRYHIPIAPKNGKAVIKSVEKSSDRLPTYSCTRSLIRPLFYGIQFAPTVLSQLINEWMAFIIWLIKKEASITLTNHTFAAHSREQYLLFVEKSVRRLEEASNYWDYWDGALNVNGRKDSSAFPWWDS